MKKILCPVSRPFHPPTTPLPTRVLRTFDRILDGVEKKEIHDDADYMADAEWAMSEQKLRGSRIAVCSPSPWCWC